MSNSLDKSVAELFALAAVEVTDRNGRETGEFVYDTNRPITTTLKALDDFRLKMRQIERSRHEEQFTLLERDLGVARSSLVKLQRERDALRAEARAYDRNGREERIIERIRLASDEATSRMQGEIVALRALVAALQSDVAALREAKRRLKAARQGTAPWR